MNIYRLISLLTGILCYLSPLRAQEQHPASCRTPEVMQQFYTLHPEAAAKDLTSRQSATRDLKSRPTAATSEPDTYHIAVVFHVYGTTQGGKTVDDALIRGAIDKLNEDFQGRNDDFHTVHDQSKPLRGVKNISFFLARLDPEGKPTTGINYYPEASGFANGSGYDALIQADAWDNYRYVNVYVQHDIFGNGTTFNSGVAYYPSSYMSGNQLARIVYNGAYLHTNTDPEFASVLTHEFGHFFNLIHTFENGCTQPNDEVEDTPPCTSAQGCHPSEIANLPQNCYGDLINAENYMDYNSGCYKMFTMGQIKRVDTALHFPSRITLWQDSTLVSTGLPRPTSITGKHSRLQSEFDMYPNPVQSHITIRRTSAVPYHIQVFNTLGQTVYHSGHNRNTTRIPMEDFPCGLYYIHISDDSGSMVAKITRL